MTLLLDEVLFTGVVVSHDFSLPWTYWSQPTANFDNSNMSIFGNRGCMLLALKLLSFLVSRLSLNLAIAN